MARELERLAYGISQTLRVSWYFGQKLLSGRVSDPVPAPPELKGRMPDRDRILRDLRRLLERDWENIAAGRYEAPELLPLRLLRSLSLGRRYFADLGAVNARRRAGAASEVSRGIEPGRYPRYYLQNFHHQTDGYLSRRSAELYDHQVEVLFGGGADAMRRQALLPLGRALAERRPGEARLIDLGCGTGRFLRMVKCNRPRLWVTGVDLSPFYLAEARQSLEPWSRTQFLEAAAEKVPLPDATFDVATTLYLFHELPAGARRRVAAEMARLLKPGGMAILVDSIQLGDEPDYDALLRYFPQAFHEPYYAQYVREDLAALFGAAGLRLESSEVAYFSKVIALRKPVP